MKRSISLFAFLVIGSASCALPPAGTTDAPDAVVRLGISEMTPAQAQAGTAAAYSQFIDVRTPAEYASGHAYRAVNIPLDVLPQNLDRIEKNEPVYLICATGRRSKQAAEILNAAGYPRVVSISGGTAAWSEAGLRMEDGESAR
jgi:rhodanese-related sulfurtransferase